MSIAKFSVKNPVLINVITIAVVVLGIALALKMNREVFPSISFGYVFIVTSYPGASPEEVEEVVTTPFEEEISDVDGIKKIQSESREGISTIIIQAESDVAEERLDQLVNDLKNEIYKVTDLPADVEDPGYLKISAEFPVVTVAVTGDVPEETLRAASERIKTKIELIDGVGTVDRFGYRDREMWISVDPRRLEAANLTLTEVILAVKKRNLNIPGGTFDQGRKEILIRTLGETTVERDLEEVVVRTLPDGVVRLGDIAEISETFEKPENIGRINGESSINLMVSKKADGDVIEIVDEIKRLAEEEKALLPKGVEIVLLQDFAKYVNRRQGMLLSDGFMGMALVVLAMFFMLNGWISFWAAVSIPITFLITIIVMYLAGITMNLLSMFGMILALGEVADKSITISENYFRYRELGYSTEDAAISATHEESPVSASKMTYIAAYLPFLFISGIVGDFLRIIPEVLIICFLVSWLQGFFILPSNLNQFVKFEIKSAQKEFRGWFDVVRDYYGRILAYCLRWRYLIFFGLISIAAVTIVLSLVTMEFVWTSKARVENFIVNVYNPVNTNLVESDRVMKEMERCVLELPPEEIESLVTNVGSVEEETGPQFGTYLGEIYVEFSEFGYTERDAEESMNKLREKVALIPGPTSVSLWAYKGGLPTGKPVSVEIRGNDFAILEKLANEVIRELETMRGVKDIETNYRKGKDEVQVIVDEHKAKTLGLDVATVATEIRYAFSGGDAGNIRRGDEKINIIVKYNEKFKNPDYLFGFSVPNAQGERIPVKSIAEVRYGQGIFKIYHSERKRTITVTADIARDETSSSTVNKALIKKFGTVSKVYAGYVYDYTGEYKDTQESLVSMIQAFWLAIGFIFIILVAFYRSILQPLIIMAAIPFGFVGVVFGLFIMGEELSLLAVIGGIVLMGAVVNNSGHLIDFINRAREDGKSPWDSVVESGNMQLRPIIMTSITMLVAIFPLAFGLGGEEPYLAPMAISMFWGMLFSTILTLFAVPCLYLIVEDIRDHITEWLGGRR